MTVKSRAHVATKDENQTNMVQSLRKIVNEEGWQGLYKGVGPKLAQSVITAAFLFAFKDYFYRLAVKARRARLAAVSCRGSQWATTLP